MHTSKADSSIDSNDDGCSNVTCANDIHNEKVYGSNEVTNDEIEIFPNDEHLLKAEFPMVFTDEGIEICSNDVHSEKAYSSVDSNND